MTETQTHHRDPERAAYWFGRHSKALDEAKPDEVPQMTVTAAEWAELKQYGSPWTKLADGRQMWGGIIVEQEDV